MIRRFITHVVAPRFLGGVWTTSDLEQVARLRDASLAGEDEGFADYLRMLGPDFMVGGEENPYLLRWWLIPRNRWFNAYLHLFLRSDDDRALHDHEYVNCSVLLAGTYTEHTVRAGGVNVRTVRKAGEVKLRLPWSAHRIELTDGPCWTLFITGPRIRKWGFHCPKGWVPWDKFTDPKSPGRVGPGCGDLA